jgi:hypothetical protein
MVTPTVKKTSIEKNLVWGETILQSRRSLIYWFLVLGILHGVQNKFPDDVSGAAVGPETSHSAKSPKSRSSIVSTVKV